MDNKNYLIFDVGGTDIKYGFLDGRGKILKKSKYSTPKSLELFLTELLDKIKQNKDRIDGISISFPGAVDSELGIIKGSSSIPYIHGPNFREIIEKETGFVIEMENDANCAALAEAWMGNAKGKKDSVLVAIGTGIGGALIKDGRIHRGTNLHGGEIGYMLSEKREDGSYSIWSDTASTRALVENMSRISGRPKEDLDGKMIFEMAERGDASAKEAIDYFYTKLAEGIYNLQYIYDPEVILLGGSISAREELCTKVEEKIEMILKKVEIGRIRPVIKQCKFMGDANLIGALYHFIQRRG